MAAHGIPAKFRARDLALATILLMSIAAFAVVTPAFAARPEMRAEHRPAHTTPFKVGTEYRILDTSSGTAFNLTDKDIHPQATLDLTVKIDKASLGRARLTVERGMLTIGSSSFTVDSGHGLINLHSMKVVIHVRVDDANGHDMHLVLFGHVTKLNADGCPANIHFEMPQSKLAGKWFLEFKGATMTKV